MKAYFSFVTPAFVFALANGIAATAPTASAETRIDLAGLKDGTFTAAGCSWNASAQQLRLPAGDYFVFDTAWEENNPEQFGSFYDANPGLNIVLEGDSSIVLSNVVAVTRTGTAVCTNSVIDLNGFDLSLTLCGANRFSVRGESSNIRAAIHVPDSSRLSIDGDGSLYAHVYGGSPACIGSNYGENSGTIIINGGTITADHQDLSSCRRDVGLNGAAIGSGGAGNAGKIEIRGGTVVATSEAWAAGIGAGANYNGDKNSGYGVSGAGMFDILITGGSVTATGGYNGGCAIGGGHSFRREDGEGAVAKVCPIRILGGSVTATAGYLQTGKNFHENCNSSAIGASMWNAGAALVIDAAATVAILPATSNSQFNHNVVQSNCSTVSGSIAVTCAAGVSDGHAFLTTTAQSRLPDVMPADGNSTKTPWFVVSKSGVNDSIVRTLKNSGNVEYSLDSAASPSSLAGVLSGLPITAFSIDGNTARFTYSRVGGTPSQADIAEFSAWFAAFGADVAILARNSILETSITTLAPDPGTSIDNGDGTASFYLTLDSPLAPERFFQLAW